MLKAVVEHLDDVVLPEATDAANGLENRGHCWGVVKEVNVVAVLLHVGPFRTDHILEDQDPVALARLTEIRDDHGNP